MSRYISVGALSEYANNQKDKSIDANEIMRFPSIDIVRCKECKHCMEYKHEEGDGLCLVRDGYSLSVYTNDFCSYGERKDDDKYVP